MATEAVRAEDGDVVGQGMGYYHRLSIFFPFSFLPFLAIYYFLNKHVGNHAKIDTICFLSERVENFCFAF